MITVQVDRTLGGGAEIAHSAQIVLNSHHDGLPLAGENCRSGELPMSREMEVRTLGSGCVAEDPGIDIGNELVGAVFDAELKVRLASPFAAAVGEAIPALFGWTVRIGCGMGRVIALVFGRVSVVDRFRAHRGLGRARSGIEVDRVVDRAVVGIDQRVIENRREPERRAERLVAKGARALETAGSASPRFPFALGSGTGVEFAGTGDCASDSGGYGGSKEGAACDLHRQGLSSWSATRAVRRPGLMVEV